MAVTWSLRLKIFFVLQLAVLGLVSFHSSQAAVVDDLTVQAFVYLDGTVSVHEKITYNFEGSKTDKVFLYLPYKYLDADKIEYDLKLSSMSLRSEPELKLDFQLVAKGNSYQVVVTNQNKFFSGKVVFQLDYIINGLIKFGLNEDRLYWNVTGNNWPVLVKQTTVRVILPTQITADPDKLRCFYGAEGKELKCRASINDSRQSQLVFIFENPFEIYSGESTRVFFRLPKGIIIEPRLIDVIKRVVGQNWLIFLPIPVLIIVLILWRQRGRDPRSGGSIEPEINPPPDLSPAELGALVDERVNDHDVFAEILFLATRGYFKITRIFNETSDDFVLTRLIDLRYTESDFQQAIITALFSESNQVSLSQIGKIFSDQHKTIEKKIYQSSVTKGYFPKSPAQVRAFYISLGLIIASIGSYYSLTKFDASLWGIVSSITSGLIIIAISAAMPRRTKKGVATTEKALGFKFFLMGGTEANGATLAKNQFQFEAYLPYSWVLGVEKDWAYQYKNVSLAPMSWYDDQSINNNFNALMLIDSLTSFQESANYYLFK